MQIWIYISKLQVLLLVKPRNGQSLAYRWNTSHSREWHDLRNSLAVILSL